MAYQLAMLAVVAGVGLAGLKLVDTVIRRPLVVAAVLVAMRVLEYAGSIPGLYVGGFNLYATDILIVITIAALAARWLRGAVHIAPTQGLLLLLTTMGLLSFARGFAQFGPKEAVVSVRGSVFPLAVALFFAVLHPTDKMLELIRKYWLYGAVALTGLAVIRWIARAGGFAAIELLQPPKDAGARVLDSNEALVIAQAFLMTLPALKGGQGRRLFLLSGWLLAIAVLLEHRSVWIALLASLAVIAVRDRQLSRRLTTLVVASAMLGSLLALTVFSGTGGEATDSLAGSATDTGTWEWRVEGWRLLLKDAAEYDTMDKLIGKPLGTPFERTVNTRTVTSQPHNYYIQLLLRFGAIGLGLLLALYARAFRKLGNVWSPPTAALNGNAMIVLLVSQLAYFINYAPRLEQGLILGVAVAMAARGTPQTSQSVQTATARPEALMSRVG